MGPALARENSTLDSKTQNEKKILYKFLLMKKEYF